MGEFRKERAYEASIQLLLRCIPGGWQMSMSLLKSILHNIGVVIVGLGVASLGRRVDLLLGIRRFHASPTPIVGCLLLIFGFLLPVWATYHFSQQRMKLISLVPQR